MSNFRIARIFLLLASSYADTNSFTNVSFNSSTTQLIPGIVSNLTMQTSFNNCDKASTLQQKIQTCKASEQCCISIVFENQFEMESRGNVALSNCKSDCRSKMSSSNIACNHVSTNYNIYRNLNYCYSVCFQNAYKCHNFNYNNNNRKILSEGEIVIVVIVLTIFFGCVCRYSVCEDFKIRRMSYQSKVHVAKTNDTYDNI